MIDKTYYEEEQTGVHVVIDYFKCSFGLECKYDDFELKVIEDTIEQIRTFLDYSKDEVVKEDFATDRFKFQYSIGNYITLKLGGPVQTSGYKSCLLEFKGHACREFEIRTKKSWKDLFKFCFLTLKGHATRIDIAVDDFDGDIASFNKVLSKLETKQFSSGFKNNNYVLHGNDEKGWTIDFGNYSSTQMLCIYQKDKEQRSRKIECKQSYWTRFEMRFFKEKAYDVATNLMDKEENELSIFGRELLYSMLDIKEDNNYGLENQRHVETVSWWNEFLGNVEKAKLVRRTIRSAYYDSYHAWIGKLTAFYIIVLCSLRPYSLDQVLLKLMEESLNEVDELDKKHIKKLNQFRLELGLNPISKEELIELKNRLMSEITLKEVPF